MAGPIEVLIARRTPGFNPGGERIKFMSMVATAARERRVDGVR